MIITFFGHSDFCKSRIYEEKVISLLNKNLGDKDAIVYLGNHGGFDDFAYNCCQKYRKSHPNLSIVYVTPYMTQIHLQNNIKKYDCIIYPEIEDKPIRFAITYRNKFMVERADYVITYVTHDWGGAYSAYKYAKSRGKTVFNLTDFDE